MNRYARKSSNSINAVVTTVWKNNTRHQNPDRKPPARSELPPGHELVPVAFKSHLAGQVIGPKGGTLERLHSTYGVQLSLTNHKHSGIRILRIWGPAENVESTRNDVASILGPLYGSRRTDPISNNRASTEVGKARQVPNIIASIVTGKSNRNINRIGNSCYTKVDVQIGCGEVH